MDNKRKKTTLIVIIAVLCISIGYAFLSTMLNIRTNISLSKVSFAVHFDNVVSLSESAIEEAHITNDDNTEISLSANLSNIGDKYTFSVDIVNDSTLPGKIKTIELTGISESNMKLIKYNVYYTGNKKEVKVGDFIGPGGTKNITVEFIYDLDDSITNSDISNDVVLLEGVFSIKYENARLDEFNNTLLSNRLIQGKTIYSSSVLNFSSSSSTQEPGGIYLLDETKNNSAPIYFYRGSNDAVFNYVIFGDYCWRIIRTTESGGIKIIYNGIVGENNQCLNVTGENTTLGQYTNGYSSNSYEWDQSRMKSNLNLWYTSNLLDYSDYIADEPYCNDNKYQSGMATLDCSSEHIVTVANGKNGTPIALITAEETNLIGVAGTSYSTSSNSWINNNLIQFTMSGSSTGMWYIERDHFYNTTHGASQIGSSKIFIRPVISLVSDAEIVSGEGTTTDPYIIG